MLRTLATALALAACVSAASSARAQAQRTAPSPYTSAQPTLPTIKLRAGLHVITAEVATTPVQRQMGLMFRKSLAPNHGMAFVFDYPSTQCMWMRNTFIPLSVAFIADDGTIVNIENMKPHDDTTPYCSTRRVRYALEMTDGWFAARGLKAGSRIDGLPQ